MPANRQNPPKDNDAIVVAARALQRTLCNNVATMNRAVAALRSCSYIVCDCEGTHLGASGGSLSLIVLCGIPTDNNRQPHVYLIDAITLKGRALEPVFALLRSDEHTKIMYDARMDWSELFHRHNVELHRVLDLELADVDSRSLRGEGPDAQLTRLFSFCKESNVESQRSSYLEIHRLNSLEACATEHGVIHSPKKVKARHFPHQLWSRRPLPKKHIQYAVLDVYLISCLYVNFVEKGYINEEKLLKQSARYMVLYQNALKPVNSGHPLLPLDILKLPSGDKRVCKGCLRALSSASFPGSASESDDNGVCWVCRAVKLQSRPKKPQEPSSPNLRLTASSSEAASRPLHQSEEGCSRAGIRHHAGNTRGYGDSGIYCLRGEDGKFGIFGYDDDETPGGNYLRDMYDSD